MNCRKLAHSVKFALGNTYHFLNQEIIDQDLDFQQLAFIPYIAVRMNQKYLGRHVAHQTKINCCSAYREILVESKAPSQDCGCDDED